MAQVRHAEVWRALTEIFGNRLRHRDPGKEVGAGDMLASVSPTNAGEVRRLSEVAARHSLRLVPVGAGTAPAEDAAGGEDDLLVRFDLMRGVRLPEDEDGWVEAETGASWLQVDQELRRHGRGLAVYPTSAPRATVGGWLATDGLGVGAFEYGRLRENILSADVVTRGGGLRQVGGEDLGYFFGPGEESGIVVAARLRTRRVRTDLPFAGAFAEPAGLAGAVAELVDSEAPLWHLAFVSPVMAAARGLRENYLLFGAYPRSRDTKAWRESRGRTLEAHGGVELDVREAWRVWGQRFFPVAPAHPTPHASRRFVTVERLPGELADLRRKDPVQGTVSRSGEVLLLQLGEDA